MHKNNYTKYLYIICLAIYGYSRACIEKRSKEKDGKHSKTVEKVDVHILTSHTTTLKSMGSKAIAIPPECTPCFALRVCQSCESCEALFFLETPQEVFFLKLVDHRKAGRFLPHLPLACLQDSDWTCRNHLHKQLEENKHGMYLHSQQGALANYGPCTGNRVAQWKQKLKYKQGNLQFEVVICTKDSMQHIWTYTIGGEQTNSPES